MEGLTGRGKEIWLFVTEHPRAGIHGQQGGCRDTVQPHTPHLAALDPIGIAAAGKEKGKPFRLAFQQQGLCPPPQPITAQMILKKDGQQLFLFQRLNDQLFVPVAARKTRNETRGEFTANCGQGKELVGLRIRRGQGRFWLDRMLASLKQFPFCTEGTEDLDAFAQPAARKSRAAKPLSSGFLT